jgi:hypothetical protein
MHGANKLNWIILSVFAPLLIVAGIAGFFVPEQYSLTSGAAPYNLFHILFGAIGLFIVSLKRELYAALFNILFGAIDLYQALASFIGLTPKQYFLWTPVDDYLHLLIGIILIAVGFRSLLKKTTAKSPLKGD